MKRRWRRKGIKTEEEEKETTNIFFHSWYHEIIILLPLGLFLFRYVTDILSPGRSNSSAAVLIASGLNENSFCRITVLLFPFSCSILFLFFFHIWKVYTVSQWNSGLSRSHQMNVLFIAHDYFADTKSLFININTFKYRLLVIQRTCSQPTL